MNLSQPQPFAAPLSGVVVGVIVKALRLEDPAVGGDSASLLGKKTVQLCFAGKRPSEKTRDELFHALAAALLQAEILPSGAALFNDPRADEREPPNAMYVELLSDLAGRWDALAGYLSTQSAPVTRRDLAAMPFLRLLIVDLSLRFAALLWLHGVRSIQERVPDWAHENGGGRYLRGLLKEAGVSRSELASMMHVSENAVDDWLDGKHPPSEVFLPSMAANLAEKLGVDAPMLRHKIRRTFAAAALCDRLAETVGRQRVEMLGRGLTRYASFWLWLQGRRKWQAAELRVAALACLLGGADLPSNKAILLMLRERETFALWKTELRWAALGSERWLERIQQCLQHVAGFDNAVAVVAAETGRPVDEVRQSMESSVELAQVESDDMPTAIKDVERAELASDPMFAARRWSTLANEAEACDDVERAVACWREAVKLDPTNASNRFFLGASLGELGHLEEAIQECRVATHLEPGWDRPQVEVGIILYNAGRLPEARAHLEAAALALSEFPANLGFVLGRTCMDLGDHASALAALERTLAVEPNNGPALEYAARCAFQLDNEPKGRAYAKDANHLGFPTTYQAWRRGDFRNK